AEADALLDLLQRVLQPRDVGRVGGEQVERDALSALRTHARQAAELVDQVLNRPLEHARTLRAEAGQAQATRCVAEATGERAHLLRLQLLRPPRGVLQRADDQILQGLDVVR